MKVQTLTLVLLLVCAVCIAPGMAGQGTRVVNDGVHLVELEQSPTVLDPSYYNMPQGEDVVVDGDQYYWVRIGNVAAGTLSSNQIAEILCKGGVAIGTGLIVAVIIKGAGLAEVGSAGAATPVAIPIAAGAITAAVEFGGNLTAEGCKIVANFFTNSKYRVVASDGTILLAVKKTNTAGIQELKKDGIDINKLTHLSKSGVRMQDEH